jgi:pilus assembly protein TadC
MFWRLIESFNDNLPLLLLAGIGLAFAAGGVPPMIERRRRRAVEGVLPGFLESLSDGVGAGLGLQEVMMDQSSNVQGPFGALLSEALSKSHSSSFDAALASFATSTRSSQVQRVVQLIQTAVEQNAPLQAVLYDLANDYQRLNDLIDKREKDLSGLVMTIVLFVCLGLPGLIAVLIGLFAPPSKGYQIDSIATTFSIFFGAASAVAVAICGRMLGRMDAMLWWLPFWSTLSMGLFYGALLMIGG